MALEPMSSVCLAGSVPGLWHVLLTESGDRVLRKLLPPPMRAVHRQAGVTRIVGAAQNCDNSSYPVRSYMATRKELLGGLLAGVLLIVYVMHHLVEKSTIWSSPSNS